MNKMNGTREEFNLSSFFNLLRLHKKFLALFISISLVIVVAYSFVVPEEYQATASMMPPEESGRGGLSDFLQSMSGGFSFGGSGQTNKLQLFGEYMKSREVARSIADTLDLWHNKYFKNMEREALLQMIMGSIEVNIKKSGLINVTAILVTPSFPDKKDKKEIAELSAKIANAAIDGLDKLNRNKSVSKAKKKRLFIEKMLTVKKSELDSIDIRLQEFQKSNKILAIENQTTAIVGNAVSIGSELAKAEIELELKRQEYGSNSAVIRTLMDKVNTLRGQYQRAQSGGLVSNDNISIPLTKVPELTRLYTNLARDQKIMEQVTLYLETQKYQEAIQEESDVPTVEPLDKALTPKTRYSPDRKLMIAVGFLISSIFAITLIIGYSMYQGRIYIKKASDQSTTVFGDAKI